MTACSFTGGAKVTPSAENEHPSCVGGWAAVRLRASCHSSEFGIKANRVSHLDVRFQKATVICYFLYCGNSAF